MRTKQPVEIHEIRKGRKKLYIRLDRMENKAEAVIDCDVFPQLACVTVPITVDQADEIIDDDLGEKKRRLIQDVFPEMDPQLREIFQTGMTPAEFDMQLRGGRLGWRHYTEKLCYVWDHDELPPDELDRLEAEWRAKLNVGPNDRIPDEESTDEDSELS